MVATFSRRNVASGSRKRSLSDAGIRNERCFGSTKPTEAPIATRTDECPVSPGSGSGHPTSAPRSLEAPACRTGVMDRVLGVAVAEVVLDEAQVVALVGEIVAALALTRSDQRVWTIYVGSN